MVESCRSSPLTHDRIGAVAMEGTSSGVTSHGPSGLNDSALLPLDHWPPLTSSWNARSDTSWLST